VDEVIDASSKFSKDTEEKMIQKMEASLRQREEQLDRLMERLQKHVTQTSSTLFSLLGIKAVDRGVRKGYQSINQSIVYLYQTMRVHRRQHRRTGTHSQRQWCRPHPLGM